MNPPLALFISLAMCSIAAADPSTYLWTGTTNGVLTTSTNWSAESGPGVFPLAAGDTIKFTTATSNVAAMDVGAGIAVNTIWWSGTSVTEGITAGTGGIALDAGGQIRYGTVASGTANVSINRPITFGGAAAIINDNNGGGSNNKQLKFDANATFTGSGTLTFSGASPRDSSSQIVVGSNNASTFTGDVIVNSGGKLAIGHAGALGDTAHGTTINDGGAVQLGSGSSEPLIVAHSGARIIAAGTASHAGDITVNSGVAFTMSTGGGNQTALSGRILGDSTNSMSVDSVRFGFTLSGSGSNTLAGTTTFNSQGTANLSKTGGAVAVAGDLTVNANAGGGASLIMKWNGNDQVANTSLVSLTPAASSIAILRLNGFSETIGGLASSGAGTSIIENLSGAANSTLTVGVSGSNSYNFGGVVRDRDGGVNAGTLALIKEGTGTQVLSGANLYTGNTTVSGGTLGLGNSGALGFGGAQTTATGTTTVNSGYTLDLAGTTGINEPIVLNGTGIGGNGALINSSGSAAVIENGIAGATVAVTGSGSGFSTAPTVAISGTGTGATAAVALGVTAANFAINSGTRTYSVAPTVTISGGGTGVGATATAVLNGSGLVTGITITNPGKGFTTVAPTITFSGGTQLVAGTAPTGTGNASGFAPVLFMGVTAASFTINSGTKTYSVAPTVAITGGGGTGATATANLDGSGLVTGITITNAGTGFTSAPTIAFSGGTQLAAGTAPTGTGNASSFSVSSLTMTSGGSGYTGTPTFTFNGVPAAVTATLSSVVLASNSSIGGSGDITINAVVSESGGARDLTKVGANTLTLNGTNLYTGLTTVTGGALKIGSGGSLASGNALTLGASGTAEFANAGQNLGAVNNSNAATNALNFSNASGTVTLASLAGAGNTRFGSNGTVTGGISTGTVTAVGILTADISGGTVSAGSLSSTTVSGGNTTVAGVATISTMSGGTANLNGATSAITTLNGGTVNLGPSTVLTVSNGISSGSITGSGGLSKSGPGTLILSGTNSYDGPTTVTDGTLLINGGLANTTTTVSGGTLGGSGTIGGAVTIDAGAKLAPGASIESLVVASADISGTLVTEYDGTGMGFIDLLVVTGMLNITNATVDFDQLGAALDDPYYIFATYGSLTGTAFANVVDLPAGYNIQYAYFDGFTANNIALVASIPEPFVPMFGGLCLFGLLHRRRHG